MPIEEGRGLLKTQRCNTHETSKTLGGAQAVRLVRLILKAYLKRISILVPFTCSPLIADPRALLYRPPCCCYC